MAYYTSRVFCFFRAPSKSTQKCEPSRECGVSRGRLAVWLESVHCSTVTVLYGLRGLCVEFVVGACGGASGVCAVRALAVCSVLGDRAARAGVAVAASQPLPPSELDASMRVRGRGAGDRWVASFLLFIACSVSVCAFLEVHILELVVSGPFAVIEYY